MGEEIKSITDREIDLEILKNYKEMPEDFRKNLDFKDYYNFYRSQKENEYMPGDEDFEEDDK